MADNRAFTGAIARTKQILRGFLGRRGNRKSRSCKGSLPPQSYPFFPVPLAPAFPFLLSTFASSRSLSSWLDSQLTSDWLISRSVISVYVRYNRPLIVLGFPPGQVNGWTDLPARPNLADFWWRSSAPFLSSLVRTEAKEKDIEASQERNGLWSIRLCIWLFHVPPSSGTTVATVVTIAISNTVKRSVNIAKNGRGI